MSIQLSVAVRNARLDAIETTVGAAPLLKLRTGAPPADCATGDAGTVIASMTLPSDWLSNASSGSKSKSGTWQDPAADAAGTLGHYRIYDAAGTTCHEQGTITITGGGGDMTVDNTNVQLNQVVTITAFSHTDGNA